jgi:acyl dehydratase
MSLYLDDLMVGQRFVSRSYVISEADIVRFAGEFDPQPFHLSEDGGRQSVFGGLAASGWHTAAITMRLLVEGTLPIAGGLIGVGAELAWPAPTRPGDTITVHSEIESVTPSRSRPDRGIVAVRSETRNQHDKPVQIFTATLLVPRKPGAAAS